jgi:hypothetical protein
LSKLEKLAMDKHSSLLRNFVNYGRKKFYNIGHGSNCVSKSFIIRITLSFVVVDEISSRRNVKLTKRRVTFTMFFIRASSAIFLLVSQINHLSFRRHNSQHNDTQLMTLSITPFSITTFSIMTLRITTFSTQHNN